MTIIRQKFPSIVKGYELNPTKGFVEVVLADGVTNLARNPSVELATTGHHAVGGSIARTTDYQRRGAYSLKVTPGAGVNDGWYYDDFADLVATLQYWGGVDIRAAGGFKYELYFATSAGALLGAAIPFTATGRWQRVHVPWKEISAAARRLYLVKDNSANTVPFYLDGVQIENKTQWTTYADGDCVGLIPNFDDFYWTGTPHASTSIRVGNSAAGGRVINLRDIGFRLLSITGLGLSGLGNQFTPIATGGAVYGGTVITDRAFTVVGDVNTPEWVGLGMNRQALTDLFKPSRVVPQQPVLLRYTPCDESGEPTGDVLEIPCVLDDGLAGQLDNLNQERIGLGFHLYLPFVAREEGDAGAILSDQDVVSAPFIIKRSPGGEWSGLSTGLNNSVSQFDGIIRARDGTIYVAGLHTSAGGVANTRLVARYDPVTDTFSALSTGVTGGTEGMALAELPDGRIVVGGDFTDAGGVANTQYLAIYDPVTDTFSSIGDADAPVIGLAVDALGRIWATGNFTDIGGVAMNRIGYYDTAWNAAGTGLDAGGAVVIVDPVAPNDAVYVGGVYTSAGGVADTIAIARYSIADGWTSVGGGVTGGTTVTALASIHGLLYAGGDMTQMGGAVTVSKITVFNGTQWLDMAGGVDYAVTPASTRVYTIFEDITNNLIYVGGLYNTVNGLPVPNGIMGWNGTGWVAPPITFGGSGNVAFRSSAIGNDGSLYLAYGTNSSPTVNGLDIINNIGTDDAYPRITITGPGTLYTLKNWTTNATLNFSLFLNAGETFVLDFSDPLSVTFTSNFRGNVLGEILPGSTFNFFLKPGNNSLGVFIAGAADSNTKITLTWRNTHTGIDGAFPNRLIR